MIMYLPYTMVSFSYIFSIAHIIQITTIIR